MLRLTYGSARFGGAVTNNQNFVWAGPVDRPTKLVDVRKDVGLCLPEDMATWGLYPTHQDSWLHLAFVVACHAVHECERGLELRRRAFRAIPASQWPALVAKAHDFASEFRARLADGVVAPRKAFKAATRALQDCLLYAVVREFPADQDGVLASSPVAGLVARANRGRAGELTIAEGLELAGEIEALVAKIAREFGGLEECRKALVELQGDTRSGRVILLPENIGLERAAALVSGDIVIGVPDAHDMDLVSIVEGQGMPELIQLTDELSRQRLDIMAVSRELGPTDQLTGGHPAFQSVAEMLLANGTPRNTQGRELVDRLASEVNPADLARKYRAVAQDFFAGGHRKSWVGRRSKAGVPQVKKVIPLYRIACDLLPRAAFMERVGTFPGGQDMASLADACGLGNEFRCVKAILDRQDASDAELEAIAAAIERHLAQM